MLALATTIAVAPAARAEESGSGAAGSSAQTAPPTEDAIGRIFFSGFCGAGGISTPSQLVATAMFCLLARYFPF